MLIIKKYHFLLVRHHKQIKNKNFTKEDFEVYLQQQRIPYEKVNNAEEQCLNLVGKELYELLFKNYTIKQWGMHPRDLEAFVTARIPLRFDHDVRYPSEKHQVLPKAGYTKMFQNILDHPNIYLQLNHHLDHKQIRQNRSKYHAIFYTGAIDSFFNYCFGHLQYRSLRFEWITHPHLDFFQKTVQCNFPNQQEYTRIVESKHITKIAGHGTTLCYEFPTSIGEPFYPMPLKQQQEKYNLYKSLSEQESLNQHPIYFLAVWQNTNIIIWIIFSCVR